MQLSKKARTIVTNLLIALGISIIVNIADILIVMRETAAMAARIAESGNIVIDTVRVGKKTYYLPGQNKEMRNLRDSIMTQAKHTFDSFLNEQLSDSIKKTFPKEILLALSLVQPDSMQVSQQDSLKPDRLKEQGGPRSRRDFRVRWAVSQSAPYQAMQMSYFFIIGFILISLATYSFRRKSPWNYPAKLWLCLLVAVAAYFLAPRVAMSGQITPTLRFPTHDMYDPTLMLKCSLLFVGAALYGKIYELISQRQNIMLENEKLKTENLQATYRTLINQMNPHFFFNSLNSLSMLVREQHNKQALTYIDRLSDTFRYILQNGSTGSITLEEELKFTDAYKYLLEIRYEGKLFINFDVDESYLNWMLPSLTLQPLLENAVKHNTITTSQPLKVNIYTDGNNNIRVSNTVNPKMDMREGTGIGLKNLSERYRLLTGKDITIVNNGKEFTVILPLIRPNT